MKLMRRWRWPPMAAMLAVVAHLLMMMAPMAAEAAPGSLLHALSIICTPDGTSQLDDGQGAVERDACDHCTLCFGLGAPLPPVATGASISHRGATAAFIPQPVDLTLLSTIAHRPAGRAPPASSTEHS